MSILRKLRGGLALLLLLSLALTGCGIAARDAQDAVPSAETPAVTAAPADETPALPAPLSVRISELMVKNRALLPDEDGDFSDWIELENFGDADVSLDGLRLTEEAGSPGLALSGTLRAGEFRLYRASGKNRSEDGHADFALSEGEEVLLIDGYGRRLSAAPCLTGEADCSVALGADGAYAESLYPTPGYPNTHEGFAAWQETLSAPAPLRIQEVCVYNLGGEVGWRLATSDWVELKNVSDDAVLLSDYFLSDSASELRRWQFPETRLMPGAIYLVRCDELGELNRPDPSTGFTLDASGEQLYLSRSDGTIADYVSLRGIPYGGSYGRMEGENGWFYFAVPSPGADNSEGCRRVSAVPTLLEPDGVFNGVESVNVALKSEGEIFYEIGDATPSVESERYTAPFSVEETTVVRAIAVEEGALPSRAAAFTYVLNENHSLPVLSLVVDPAREFMWSYYSGNKYRESPATLSLYEEDGGFSVPCGVKLHGETSLELEKKNMAVRLRSVYGQSELHYDIYGGGIDRFRTLVLRAGQDYFSTAVKNALCQNLCLQAGNRTITGRSKFCILYLNGKYWGIYTLMEKTNEQLYADLLGVSKKSTVVIESPAAGTSPVFTELFDYCKNHDLSVQENYEYVKTILDVDSVIDWIALEGYCANTDLTYGNVRYARSTEGDGKWRLVFYDLDATFWDPVVAYTNMFDGIALYSRQIGSCLIRPLLQNAEFKDRMLRRIAELMDTVLSAENVTAEFKRLIAQIEPEIERDYAAHGLLKDRWESDVDYLLEKFEDDAWNKNCIDMICRMLQLTDEERAEYFGE